MELLCFTIYSVNNSSLTNDEPSLWVDTSSEDLTAFLSLYAMISSKLLPLIAAYLACSCVSQKHKFSSRHWSAISLETISITNYPLRSGPK